jgi:hypothetical protein
VPKVQSCSKGFSIIEILFSISITLIIFVSFYGLTAFLHRDYVRQGAFAESLQESRVATYLLNQDIQNANTILEASETTFALAVTGQNDTHYKWLGESCNSGCVNNEIPYTLYRKIGKGGFQEVALGIQSFRLLYFDENGVPLPSGLLTQPECNKIRKVVLTLQPLTKENKEAKKHGWRTEIYLKNIG